MADETTTAPAPETAQAPTTTQQQQPQAGGFDNVRLYSSTLPIMLRNPEPRDDTVVHEITSDPAIYDTNVWLARRASISEADALNKIHKMRAYAAAVPPARIELVVVLLSAPGAQEDGTVIGLSGIRDFHERPGKKIAEVGASIITAQRHKGYFIEALKLSIDFALERAGCNAIQIMIHEDSSNKMELLKDEFGWKRGAVDGQGKYRRYDADKLRWVETKEHIAKRDRQSQEGFAGNLGRKIGRLFKGN
jgi:RimJ/RimL family protein N-acetyltransferase